MTKANVQPAERATAGKTKRIPFPTAANIKQNEISQQTPPGVSFNNEASLSMLDEETTELPQSSTMKLPETTSVSASLVTYSATVMTEGIITTLARTSADASSPTTTTATTTTTTTSTTTAYTTSKPKVRNNKKFNF